MRRFTRVAVPRRLGAAMTAAAVGPLARWSTTSIPPRINESADTRTGDPVIGSSSSFNAGAPVDSASGPPTGEATTSPPSRPGGDQPNSGTTSAAAGAGLDEKTAEQLRIAMEIGEEGFEENVAILKQLALRGLRALVVCAVGVGTFWYAVRRRREAERKLKEKVEEGWEEDPTQRYLEEMRSLGFDVDTLEEELEAERTAKPSNTNPAPAK